MHEGRPVLYHVICLQNTPPTTIDEQQCCLESKTSCWRLRSSRRKPRADADETEDAEDAEPDVATSGVP